MWAKPTLLVLGDSLSAAYQIPPERGWVALLNTQLKNDYPTATVINSSVTGDTTANGLTRLPSLLQEYHPDIVIIELGGNDGLRGLPIDTIKANLSTMITLCFKQNAKIILIGMRLPPNYGPEYTEKFANIYSELNQTYKISVVPFLLEKVALNPKLMQADGIHPTEIAQPLLLETVWPTVKSLLTQELGL